MNYDLKSLDFDAIRRLLENMALTPYGKEAARGLVPAPNVEVALRMQNAVTEARGILDTGSEIPLQELPNILPSLKQASATGSALSPNALYNLKTVLKQGEKLAVFLIDHRDLYPPDQPRIHIEPSLLDLLDRSLEGANALKASASPDLERLHTELHKARTEVERLILAEQCRQELADYLAETRQVHWHGERAVLVVRNQYADTIKGVRRGNKYGSQDQLIEPIAAVGLNNRIEKLVGDIRNEQQRILREITDRVRENLVDLHTLVDAITWIDLAHAGGRLSEYMNAHAPQLQREPGVRLDRAYHPLLLIQFVQGNIARPVPLSITLDNAQRFLLITGPNTGGKTVALKTLGILVAMAQCGLHIPADGDCAIGWYTSIMVDMGDRQSLYHQLSTFAGHVQMMKQILDVANGSSLLLLDELGTGTDPEEGAALAMAVLDELTLRGCQGILNTHLSPLKEYAEKTQFVKNASVKFDFATLSPTYELVIGEHGASLGLTIAERNGLASSIIEQARRYLKEIQTR